jgi:hypothetical protein
MAAMFARPRVAELVFRLYDRSFHPELFDSFASRKLERGGYRLAVHITPSGHILDWSHGDERITEATVTADQLVPGRGQRLSHRFGGSRGGRCEVRPGLRYQIGTQVEILTPELFEQVHHDLRRDGERKGLLFQFRPENRLRLSPIGVVIVEALPQCLAIAAFHTFPEEFAVVKTQSLIERA